MLTDGTPGRTTAAPRNGFSELVNLELLNYLHLTQAAAEQREMRMTLADDARAIEDIDNEVTTSAITLLFGDPTRPDGYERREPHDFVGARMAGLPREEARQALRGWLESRYNVWATTTDDVNSVRLDERDRYGADPDDWYMPQDRFGEWERRHRVIFDHVRVHHRDQPHYRHRYVRQVDGRREPTRTLHDVTRRTRAMRIRRRRVRQERRAYQRQLAYARHLARVRRRRRRARRRRARARGPDAVPELVSSDTSSEDDSDSEGDSDSNSDSEDEKEEDEDNDGPPDDRGPPRDDEDNGGGAAAPRNNGGRGPPGPPAGSGDTSRHSGGGGDAPPHPPDDDSGPEEAPAAVDLTPEEAEEINFLLQPGPRDAPPDDDRESLQDGAGVPRLWYSDHGREGEATLYLSRAKLRAYIESSGGPSKLFTEAVSGGPAVPADKKVIDVINCADDIPPAERKRVEDLLEEFRDVFQTNPTGGVKPCNAPPIRLLWKDGKVVYCRCPRPKWSKEAEIILAAWAEQQVRLGYFKPDPSCKSAYRPHIAPKAGGKLRICIDFRDGNRHLDKAVPRVPKGNEEAQKLLGHQRYITCDFFANYNQFIMPEEDSKGCGCWVPGRFGIIRPTRKFFGELNAGVGPQAYVYETMSELAAAKDGRLACFRDDLSMGVDATPTTTIWDELLRNCRELLEKCRESGQTLKPSKFCYGFTSAEFYGWRIDATTIQPLKRVLAPILAARSPDTVQTDKVSALRRVLGLFNTLRHRVPRYSERIRPMTALLRKGTKWEWTRECEEAFQAVLATLRENVILHKHDPDHPLTIRCDASDGGWGVAIFQVIPTADGADQRNVLLYDSGRWTPRQAGLPVYYREFYALVYGCKAAAPFVAESKFIPIVEGDHQPLTWVNHSRRDFVLQALLDEHLPPHFQYKYLPGPQNVTADALSREPFLPQATSTTLAPSGLSTAVRVALDALPATAKSARFFVFAHGDTLELQRAVRSWQAKTAPPISRGKPTTENLVSHRDDIIVLVPDAPDSAVVTRRALECAPDTVLCVLLPSELVRYVSLTEKGTRDHELAARIRSLHKIVFTANSLIWLIQGARKDLGHSVYSTLTGHGEPDKSVYARTRYVCLGDHHSSTVVHQHLPLADVAKGSRAGLEAQVGTLAQWRKEQTNRAVPEETKIIPHVVGDVTLGAVLDKITGVPKILVPVRRRYPLITLIHEEYLHSGVKKTLQVLLRQYWWPGITADVKTVLKDCHSCAVANARVNRAHQHFARTRHKGRTASIDHHAYPQDIYGCTGILMVVTESAYVILIAVRDKSAATTARSLINFAFPIIGFPDILRSDEDAGHMSTLMECISDAHGVNRMSTGGYHPTGLAEVERRWDVINRFMRIMTPDQVERWSDFTGLFMMVMDSTTHRRLAASPAEHQHGRPLRMPTDALLRSPATKVADEGSPPTTAEAQEQIRQLRVLLLHFKNLARESQLEYETAIDRLNARGRKADFEVGDLVSYYMPAKRALTASVKHSLQFRAPAKVIAVLEGHVYKIKDQRNGKLLTRHVSSLRKYEARPQGINGLLQFRRFTRLERGVFIVARQDRDATDVFVAQVTRGDDKNFWYHKWAAKRDTRVSHAYWYPVWAPLPGSSTQRRVAQVTCPAGYKPYVRRMLRSAARNGSHSLVVADSFSIKPRGRLPTKTRHRVLQLGFQKACQL